MLSRQEPKEISRSIRSLPVDEPEENNRMLGGVIKNLTYDPYPRLISSPSKTLPKRGSINYPEQSPRITKSYRERDKPEYVFNVLLKLLTDK
jgi:hypothetical protein